MRALYLKFLSIGLLIPLLVASAMSQVAHATPITYFVNFSGAGTLPGVGVFTYDASAQNFSNFFVSWDGGLFDLTAEANAPLVFSGCAGEASSPSTGFALMSQSLCAGSVYSWSGENSFNQKRFGFQVGGGAPNRQLFIQDSLTSSDFFDLDSGFGTWTLFTLPNGPPPGAPVPEPSTLVLLLFGVSLLVRRLGPISSRAQ